MLPDSGSLVILSSMMGYGVYLPARIVNRQLSAAGIPSALYLIENLFTAEKKKTFLASRKAFGKNYRLAQLAAKVPVDYHSCIDQEAAHLLYEIWDQNGVTGFLCFSGLWLEVLEGYVPASGIKNIRCCRIDAGESPTWANRDYTKVDHLYYFSDLHNRTINYKLSIPSLQPVSYPDRHKAVVVHGGGWGLGDYVQKTKALEQAGYARKIILNDPSGFRPDENNTSFFVADPDWDPLVNAGAEQVFPPLGTIEDGQILYTYYPEHHTALKLVNESKAVISKPGGMTLVDAIITETPFIYLEPMGANEAGNTVLIDHYQLGASYAAWKESGFSEQLLLDCHHNIRTLKATLPDFVTCYQEDLKNATARIIHSP